MNDTWSLRKFSVNWGWIWAFWQHPVKNLQLARKRKSAIINKSIFKSMPKSKKLLPGKVGEIIL
jgi:hypothetical protein